MDQGPATAAFSLSHQISQVEAKCLNIMSKLAGDKVEENTDLARASAARRWGWTSLEIFSSMT